ncbi:hypothetical protein RFI_32128 [Reticulomyxa filosa]|uniref:Protein kinase domain-containing protein n=1 Tax=Reticulomyxa filosa TaxID=46433 RepID=X6LTL1_RETFI|nr:hypothetical protein RFI_32128 [Reticulomyxa filosa]|eukprot:ETO05268.1 hypothetical protein RFI_32128 [Reticulomyxa filosa]
MHAFFFLIKKKKVLEYMEKGAILKTNGNPTCDPIKDLELVRKYMRDMILGLDYLHRNNIIHADIKPDNLLIGPDDSVRIADFGVSYMLESSDGTVSKALGTPAFIAPECERYLFFFFFWFVFGSLGLVVTLCDTYFRAYPLDIWALGVTLYMMIAGVCPFAGESIQHTFEKIQSYAPTIPSDLPMDLQHLLSALLNKDPAKRINMAQLKNHPWITRMGQEPLRHPRNVKMIVEVEDWDVEEAVTLPTPTVTTYRRESQENIHRISSQDRNRRDDEKDSANSAPNENSTRNQSNRQSNGHSVKQKDEKSNREIKSSTTPNKNSSTTPNKNGSTAENQESNGQKRVKPPRLFQGVRPKNT